MKSLPQDIAQMFADARKWNVGDIPEPVMRELALMTTDFFITRICQILKEHDSDFDEARFKEESLYKVEEIVKV